MKNTITLLLLTCGTNACYHTAKRLKESFGERIRIVGTDINQRWMIATQPYLDEFYQCPLSSNASYYGFIIALCDKEQVDYLLPSFDADQLLFHQGNLDLIQRSVKSLGITQEAAGIYHSKEETNQFLLRHNLPVPKFYDINETEEQKKYLCKPVNGVGSAGVKILTGREIRELNNGSLLIEEICNEPEITLECFNYQGKVYSIARERLDAKAGVCTKTRAYYDRGLETIAQQFADSIDLPYIFNLQFMTDGEGRKVITDVNLRMAGGMSLSYAARWDETTALGKIMLGESDVTATLKAPEKDVYVIRAYTDIVTKACEKRIAFDLDGTLLDSRARHRKVMDDVLNEYGLTLDTSDLVSYKAEGCNNKDWLRNNNVEGDLIKQINNRWIELIEQEQYLDGDLLYPGVREHLMNLSLHNALFLITARNNNQNAERQINKLGIREFFDKIAIVPSTSKTSEAKALLLREYRVDEFIGDTESDMKAAELANCQFKAVMDGFRSPSFWNQFSVEKVEIK